VEPLLEFIVIRPGGTLVNPLPNRLDLLCRELLLPGWRHSHCGRGLDKQGVEQAPLGLSREDGLATCASLQGAGSGLQTELSLDLFAAVAAQTILSEDGQDFVGEIDRVRCSGVTELARRLRSGLWLLAHQVGKAGHWALLIEDTFEQVIIVSPPKTAEADPGRRAGPETMRAAVQKQTVGRKGSVGAALRLIGKPYRCRRRDWRNRCVTNTDRRSYCDPIGI